MWEVIGWIIVIALLIFFAPVILVGAGGGGGGGINPLPCDCEKCRAERAKLPKKRFVPPPNPGETGDQYFARTGIRPVPHKTVKFTNPPPKKPR